VPSYTWGEEGNPIMVSDKTYMKGTVDELRAISTDPDGVPMPGTDYHAWVVLDCRWVRDVIQCKASQLIKLEE
tara:strand:- start:2514 stop:2732 length:219 start_codon:yes stop_codon:yes gene_type:complete